VLPSQSTDEVLAQIDGLTDRVAGELAAEQASRGHTPRSTTPAISLEPTISREPYSVPADDPYVRLLCRAVEPYRAERAAVRRVQHGAGDVAFLGGIPGVEFGLRGGGHHGASEWLDTTSLVPYAQALLDHIGLIARTSMGRLQRACRCAATETPAATAWTACQDASAVADARPRSRAAIRRLRSRRTARAVPRRRTDQISRRSDR